MHFIWIQLDSICTARIKIRLDADAQAGSGARRASASSSHRGKGEESATATETTAQADGNMSAACLWHWYVWQLHCIQSICAREASWSAWAKQSNHTPSATPVMHRNFLPVLLLLLRLQLLLPRLLALPFPPLHTAVSQCMHLFLLLPFSMHFLSVAYFCAPAAPILQLRLSTRLAPISPTICLHWHAHFTALFDSSFVESGSLSANNLSICNAYALRFCILMTFLHRHCQFHHCHCLLLRYNAALLISSILRSSCAASFRLCAPSSSRSEHHPLLCSRALTLFVFFIFFVPLVPFILPTFWPARHAWRMRNSRVVRCCWAWRDDRENSCLKCHRQANRRRHKQASLRTALEIYISWNARRRQVLMLCLVVRLLLWSSCSCCSYCYAGNLPLDIVLHITFVTMPQVGSTRLESGCESIQVKSVFWEMTWIRITLQVPQYSRSRWSIGHLLWPSRRGIVIRPLTVIKMVSLKVLLNLLQFRARTSLLERIRRKRFKRCAIEYEI